MALVECRDESRGDSGIDLAVSDECFPRLGFCRGMKLDVQPSVLADNAPAGLVPRNRLDLTAIDLAHAFT
jgi:hypothetical protein